jgi:hypothetical protein
MKFVIRPNRHHAFPPPLGYYTRKHSFSKEVLFTPSCRYYLEGLDYYDINKLFGVGYGTPREILSFLIRKAGSFVGLCRRPISPHHFDSARFGWRYDEVNDKIALYAYCHVNFEMVAKHICDLVIGRPYQIKLFVAHNAYWFSVKDNLSVWQPFQLIRIPFTHEKTHKYALGPYFGGQKRAPHKITIYLKNVPK